MNIVFFSDTFLPQINGVVTHLIETGRQLKKMGHQVLFVVPKCPKGLSESPPEKGAPLAIRKNPHVPEGFRAKEIFFAPSLSINRLYPQYRMAIAYSYGLDKALSEFSPDILHMHTPMSIGFGGIVVAKRFNKPLVGTYHTFAASEEMFKIIGIKKGQGTRLLKRLMWEYTNLFYNRCNAVIATTGEMATILKRNGVNRSLIVIHEGIGLSDFKILTQEEKEKVKDSFGLSGKKVAVFTGRLSREKNLTLMINAFAQVATRLSEAHLLMIGDGPAREELMRRTQKLGISDRVTFTGFMERSDLIRSGILGSCNLFLSTSKFETFGISALEAIASGLPVVMVESQGVAELIDGNGLISSDQEKDIAENVIKILMNPEMEKRFGERSLVVRERYAIEKVTEELVNFYEGTIRDYNKRPTRRRPSLSDLSKLLGL